METSDKLIVVVHVRGARRPDDGVRDAVSQSAVLRVSNKGQPESKANEN